MVIYDLQSLRKRKILTSSDIQSDEYISVAFSPDSKYLATQSAAPEWTLLYWTWEKAKVLASVKISNPQGNTAINQVYVVHFSHVTLTEHKSDKTSVLCLSICLSVHRCFVLLSARGHYLTDITACRLSIVI